MKVKFRQANSNIELYNDSIGSNLIKMRVNGGNWLEAKEMFENITFEGDLVNKKDILDLANIIYSIYSRLNNVDSRQQIAEYIAKEMNIKY